MKVFDLIEKEDYAGLEALLNKPKDGYFEPYDEPEFQDFVEGLGFHYDYSAKKTLGSNAPETDPFQYQITRPNEYRDFSNFLKFSISKKKPKAFGIILSCSMLRNIDLGIEFQKVNTIINAIIRQHQSDNIKTIMYLEQIPQKYQSLDKILASFLPQLCQVDLIERHILVDLDQPLQSHGILIKEKTQTNCKNTINWIITESSMSLRGCLHAVVSIESQVSQNKKLQAFHEKALIEAIDLILELNQEKNKSNAKDIFKLENDKYSILIKSYRAKNYEVFKKLLDLDIPFRSESYQRDLRYLINSMDIELIDPMDPEDGYKQKLSSELFLLAFKKYGGFEAQRNVRPCLLAHAIQGRAYKAVECLLNNGYNLAMVDSNTDIPEDKLSYFHKIIYLEAFDPSNPVEHTKWLTVLKKYLDINNFKTWESVSLLRLFKAKKWDLIKHIVKLKSNPNECDEQGNCITDIIHAIQSGEITFKLLSYNDRVSIRAIQDMISTKDELIFIEHDPQLPEIIDLNHANNALNLNQTMQEIQSVLIHKAKALEKLYAFSEDKLKLLKQYKIQFRKAKAPSTTCKEQKQQMEQQNNTIESDYQVIKILSDVLAGNISVLDSSQFLCDALSKMQRYKKFTEEARFFWKLDKTKANEVRKDIKTYQNKTFELDQFVLHYYDFANEYEFNKSLKELINLLKSDFGSKVRSALCYQTVAQHKEVLWSLSHRQRFISFQAKLKQLNQPDPNPRKTINTIKKKSISFGPDITLNFMDLRPFDDYNFMVHTTSGNPEKLEVTLQTGANFIRSTRFFSCSLVDKDTEAGIMAHQGKTIFPISLILDLADDAVLKAFSVDAWSPMLSFGIDDVAQEYSETLLKMKQSFNALEYMARTEMTEPQQHNSTSLSLYDSERILAVISNDPEIRLPDNLDYGHLPDLGPHLVLKQTKSHFNEIIVAGKEKNKVIGILVEEAALITFIEQYGPMIEKVEKYKREKEKENKPEKERENKVEKEGENKAEKERESKVEKDNGVERKNVSENRIFEENKFAAENKLTVEYKLTSENKLTSEKKLTAENVEKAIQSLRLLAQCKYPLVLVKTRSNTELNKTPTIDKYKKLHENFYKSVQKAKSNMLKHYRLKKSKHAERNPSLAVNSQLNLQSVLQELQKSKQDLISIQDEILGRRI